MSIATTPLGANVALEVSGVEVDAPVPVPVAVDLRQSLARHEVLVFRGQEGLSTRGMSTPEPWAAWGRA